MMLNKNQAALGHPKNVTINILDGNSFFSLDYQPPQKIDPMNYTLTSFLGHNQNEGKDHIHKNGTPNFKITNHVQSAQYSRKMLQSNVVNRMSVNPYIRIRRVDQIIKEQKSYQTSIDHDTSTNMRLNLQHYSTTLPVVTDYKTQRSNRSEQKQKFLKSLTIDPQSLTNNSNNHQNLGKKISKANNTFSENYKNRRKLLEKVTHSKNSNRVSPLRWDIKLKELQQRSGSLKKSQEFKTFRDRLNKANDPLLRKIQGNRIKYTIQEPKSIKYRQQIQEYKIS